MDIEWAKDGVDGALYIVQARPETVASQQAATNLESYVLKETGPRCWLRAGPWVPEIGSGPVRVVVDSHHLPDFKDRARCWWPTPPRRTGNR